MKMENGPLLDLKPFQETLHRGMCGAASLLIVLDHYGIEKSEEELATMLGVDGKMGTDSDTIKKVAESLGFSVEIKNESSFKTIALWLQLQVPVIVDWFTRGRGDYPDDCVADGHYSVVAGLDAEFVYLMDPEIGGVRKLARNDFLRVWFDFEGEYIKSDKLIVRQVIAIHRELTTHN